MAPCINISMRTFRKIGLKRQLLPMISQKELKIIKRPMSTLNEPSQHFEEFFKVHHIATTPLQKAFLSVGSATLSLLDPTRADSIAVFGEASGEAALKYMEQKMKSSDEGKKILQNKPRINSKTINLEKLKDLPRDSLGGAYINFLDHNQVTPDSRLQVQFVDDVELAYVMQRYREAHDLIHTVLGMPTNMLGEVAVKWVEGIQTRLPMCLGGALFGPLRFGPKQRLKYIKYYLPWSIKTGREASFLLNIYWEQRWEQPMDDLLKELNINRFVEPKSS